MVETPFKAKRAKAIKRARRAFFIFSALCIACWSAGCCMIIYCFMRPEMLVWSSLAIVLGLFLVGLWFSIKAEHASDDVFWWRYIASENIVEVADER